MDAEGERSVASELALAREAQDDGDPRDALAHLAVALSLSPLDEDALTLLDDVLEAAGASAPDALVVGDGTFFGLFALRAYALARLGRFDEACGLLFDVASFRPTVPYVAWLERWTRRGWGGTPGEAFGEAFASRVVSYAKAAGAVATDGLDVGVRRNLEAALGALNWLADGVPPRSRLAFATSYVLRKLGRGAEAAAVSSDWFAREPSWVSAVEAAAACRSSGDGEGALRCYGEALARRPEDVATRLDIGDVLLDGERYEEAARAYGEVLERDPSHPWAEPSFAFARYATTREVRWREALQSLARKEPGRGRATALAERWARLPGRPMP